MKPRIRKYSDITECIRWVCQGPKGKFSFHCAFGRTIAEAFHKWDTTEPAPLGDHYHVPF